MHSHRFLRLDLVVRETAPPLLEHYATLEARERRAEAEVHAATEREAGRGVAADVVFGRSLEGAFVAVGGAHEQERALPGAQRLAVDFDVARDPPREHLRGIVEAQRLLDPARDPREGSLAHERALLGVAPQPVD